MNKSVAYPLGCVYLLDFQRITNTLKGVLQIIHKLYFILKKSRKLVSEIEILEKQIAENEAIIQNSASHKQAVLKKYL